MSARVWSSDPVKLAKRRGVLGMIAGAVLVVFAGAFLPFGGPWPPYITVFAVSAFALAVLVFAVSAIAFGIMRRHPDVGRLRRPNDLVTVAALIFGVLAIVDEIVLSIGQPDGSYLGTGMIVVILALITGAVLVLSGANRTAIREAETTTSSV